MNKISIRFYNDREVRAIWSEDDCRWFYSATDVVRAINNENDYVKAGNYWRWLKKKLAAQGVQPVSDTHEFKLVGPDGKKRVADVMDDNGVLLLAKHYPNNRGSEIESRDNIRTSGTEYSYVGLSARNNALKGQPDHSPGQAKRHPGNRIGIINEQRPERAEA